MSCEPEEDDTHVDSGGWREVAVNGCVTHFDLVIGLMKKLDASQQGLFSPAKQGAIT